MSDCTCFPVPEKYWTTHYGAVDPATTMEPNPECPEHFPIEGVVVKHSPPELLVTIDTEGDTTHNWMKIGWIAQDG